MRRQEDADCGRAGQNEGDEHPALRLLRTRPYDMMCVAVRVWHASAFVRVIHG